MDETKISKLGRLPNKGKIKMNDFQGTSAMALAQRLKTTPVSFQRNLTPDDLRCVTSGDPGLTIPLGFISLDREDALETSFAQCRAYMDETADLLMNTVYATFSAYLVPKKALDRFGQSTDALNRAWNGQPEMDGSQIDWIETHTFRNGALDRPVYLHAGLHAATDATLVNTDYVQSYDKVFEYRCRQRSEALWQAVEADVTGDGSLHPAFFDNPQMSIVKASFDNDQLEGEVPLSVANAMLPVKGIGIGAAQTHLSIDDAVLETGGGAVTYPQSTYSANEPGQNVLRTRVTGAAGTLVPDVYSELAEDGIVLSLANYDLSRETQAWARVRNQYSGITDQDMVDMLMAGLTIPDAHLSKPVLLDRVRVPMGMTQRYSSDADNLDVSATKGAAGATLQLRTPQVSCGGTIVIIAEVVPEQFWERSADYTFLADNDTRRPDRLLDQLDPQAIEVVENFHADVAHSDPTGVFGYAPLNHAKVKRRYSVGGKFYKSDPAAPFAEVRNRIWASEPIDPTLSRELFLATDIPNDIFISTDASTVDNLEFSMVCEARVSGLTFIGPLLREGTDDYDTILDRVDKTRIEGTPVDELTNDESGDVLDDDDDQIDDDDDKAPAPAGDEQKGDK